jgi:uncharacterized protein YgiM (DUF1202 family)
MSKSMERFDRVQRLKRWVRPYKQPGANGAAVVCWAPHLPCEIRAEEISMESRGAFSRRRFLAGAAGLTALALAPTLGTVSSAAARSTDSLIVNTAGARLRSGAGTGFGVIASLAKGTEVRYLADGGNANGYRWYKVLVLSTGKEGFVAASLLSAPDGSGGNTGPFAIGASFWVKVANANMRSGAGTGYGVIKILPQGSQGVVQAGSVSANGYTWYQVKVGASTGWVATVVMGTTPGNPGIPYNVTVVDGPLNVRQYPTVSSAVVGTVQTGHQGWLTQRTFVEADGHRWAEVTFESGRQVHGYVSTSYVEIT